MTRRTTFIGQDRTMLVTEKGRMLKLLKESSNNSILGLPTPNGVKEDKLLKGTKSSLTNEL
jgi:hypothetical protein